MAGKNSVCDIPVDFKSTLPPRKRAKTVEEKEQRRIERVLRNRKAAHQSREKKRLHMQKLEEKCGLLEEILNQLDLDKLAQEDVKVSSLMVRLKQLKQDEESAKDCSSYPAASTCSPRSTVLDSPESIVTPNSQKLDHENERPTFQVSSEKSENETPKSFLQSEDVSLVDATFGLVDQPVNYTIQSDGWNLLMTAPTELEADFPQNPLDFADTLDLDTWRNPAVIAT